MDQSGLALYTIETAEAYTVISSARQQQQSRRRPQSIATIQWPRRFTASQNKSTIASDALVTMNGETTPSGRLLRQRKVIGDGKSYKFRIAGYKPTFRWKRHRRQYQLFVTGLKQSIATISSDNLTSTFSLQITGAPILSHHNQDRPGFVSSVLLDHIVVTSLLLVTPCLEWRRVCGATATRTTMSTISSDGGEEPPTFVYTAPASYSRDPFSDDCHPVMPPRAAYPHQNHIALAPMQLHDTSRDLQRRPSTTSSTSSRTLVQNLVYTVLASISSDRSSMFASSSTDILSSEGTPSMTMTSDHRGVSTASLVTPPPPYERAGSRR